MPTFGLKQKPKSKHLHSTIVDIMFDEQIDHIEDVIVNHFGVEVYPE